MTLSCMQAFMARDPLAKMGYEPQLIASFVYVRTYNIDTQAANDPKPRISMVPNNAQDGCHHKEGCPGPCVLAPDGLDTIDLDSIDLEID